MPYSGKYSVESDIEQAISFFKTAREHYIAGHFEEARIAIQRYRQAVDYGQFEQIDQRANNEPEVSIIVVSFHTNHVLLECLDSIFKQQGPHFEIILVDNGGNHSIHAELAKKTLLWVTPPINLFPSEGRNVGSYFARSDLLVFLDDDARMTRGHLRNAVQAMADKKILGMRGRVLPKTANTIIPAHYDLGNRKKFAEFNFEGNMVIRANVYHTVGGFDPLMYGHEGKELTQRVRTYFSGQQIVYTPTLVVQHDWAKEQKLAAKRERQANGMRYLKYLKGYNMSTGITILLRAGDNLAAAEEFLTLLRYDIYKSIEVFLWAKDTKQALALSRTYLTSFFVRVLPPIPGTLGHICQQIRYDKLLIVDVPIKFNGDLSPEWVQQVNSKNALLCNKHQLNLQPKSLLTTPFVVLMERFSNLTTQNIPSGYKTIKVSIIIPVFNKCETIKRAFNSILSAGRDDIECVFVDDFSLDGSRQVLEEIKSEYKNIVCIFNEKNLGAGASRNIGINKATGEYIFFLDVDDQLNASVLSELIECADKNQADLVRGKLEGVKSNGEKHWVAKEYLLHQYTDQRIGVRWHEECSLWFYWYFYSNLYRRSFINKNHIRFSEGVRSEDPLFLAKCFLYAKNIILYPLSTYIYTISEAQTHRSGSFFLHGWAYENYAIYQLICSSKTQRQAAHFLCHFPSLEKHCHAIMNSFDEKDALKLFNCISVMFRSFDDKIKLCENHLKNIAERIKPWEKRNIDGHIEFAKAISGRNAAGIYQFLKSK